MSKTVLLNVKFSSSNACQVEVNTENTIEDLKRKIAEKCGVNSSDIQLILAGKVLGNDSALKDLQIGNCTVLHAFQQKTDIPSTQTSNSRAPEENSQASEHEYFVYCKRCKSLQPGRLRVVCARCKQGQIILDTLNREPQGFEDVLQAGAITGECKSVECQTRQNAQFYFKCSHHQSDSLLSNELDQSEAVLQHIRPNRKQIECITCSEVVSPVLIFPCDRHHVMCLDCFTTYCIVQLTERRFVEDPAIGYSLPCPAGCPASLIKDAHHFHLLGEEQYERYKNFGVEEFVLQNGGLLCPAIGCGTGFLLENSNRKITCPACRAEFCRDCRRDYHSDEECGPQAMGAVQQGMNIDLEQEMRASWDTQSLETIEKISKPCPNCKTKTERSGGCMHMKCSRCGEDWCWMCNVAWNRECQGNHWFG